MLQLDLMSALLTCSNKAALWNTVVIRRILTAVSKFFNFGGQGSSELSEWYEVGFGEEQIWRDVRPPGKPAFQDRVYWKDIIRVVFEASDLGQSDCIFIYSNLRPESYAIPADAQGADHLWNEIVDRGLFDPDLAVEAALSSGGFYCWPPEQG
jgi:hypothetical protein